MTKQAWALLALLMLAACAQAPTGPRLPPVIESNFPPVVNTVRLTMKWANGYNTLVQGRGIPMSPQATPSDGPTRVELDALRDTRELFTRRLTESSFRVLSPDDPAAADLDLALTVFYKFSFEADYNQIWLQLEATNPAGLRAFALLTHGGGAPTGPSVGDRFALAALLGPVVVAMPTNEQMPRDQVITMAVEELTGRMNKTLAPVHRLPD